MLITSPALYFYSAPKYTHVRLLLNFKYSGPLNCIIIAPNVQIHKKVAAAANYYK